MEPAMTKGEKASLRLGLAFISPWLIGFLAFCAYPLISSIYYSFCDYSVLSQPVFIGLQNYRDLAGDALFWKSIYNTAFFAIFAIPLGLAVSLTLALLLHCSLPGTGIFRTIFFLPSLVPLVCLGVLWKWMLNGQLGLINNAIDPGFHLVNKLLGTHLAPPDWLSDAHYAKWGVIFAVLWGVGNSVVIYLAGLQEVPRHLYEAAEIDGANAWQKTWHITLPILSPVIYFNTVMGLIGSLQVFAIPYVMTDGTDGPGRSLLFVTTYLFRNAFDYWNMGYACAIGVILFLLILSLTMIATKLSQNYIYYAGK
jgi:multiple sugar transport system permease protein